MGRNPTIEFIKIITLFHPVEVITNINLESISTTTFKMDKKMKDSKVKMPLWLAEKLIEEGKVRVPEATFNWLNQVLWKEKARFNKKNIVISRQNEDFYPKLFLIEYALKKDKTLLFDENTKQNMKNLIRLIVNKRLEAIVKMAESGDMSTWDRLTPEEKILFKLLREIMMDWMEFTEVDKL